MYHFSLSRDSIGIFFFPTPTRTCSESRTKKFCGLLQGKIASSAVSQWEEVTCFLGKITEQGRNHSKGTLIYECLETHWENLIPYNCCAEAERQPFNLWTATATQPKKASMWSLEMMEVRVGKDLFFCHGVWPPHSARKSPQTDNSSITDLKNHISRFENDTLR